MSGTAFNGSPWLTAAEIGGLVLCSFGGAAVGAMLIRRGLQRKMDGDLGSSEAEIAKQLSKQPKRRRYAATELAAAREDNPAEELVPPNVVEDGEQKTTL